jgi:hypothetical protein
LKVTPDRADETGLPTPRTTLASRYVRVMLTMATSWVGATFQVESDSIAYTGWLDE